MWKRLSRVGWAGALGELALIVVGVLLALAAAEWQGRRSERGVERAVLAEMSEALSKDVEQLQAGLDRFGRIEASTEIFLSHISSKSSYVDSLDAHFGAFYWISSANINLNSAAYESLKWQGLRLISDQALRSQIVQVYERSYARLQDSLDRERETVLEVLRPYFVLHFVDIKFGKTARPLDYAAMSNDAEFINLVAYRLELLRANHITRFEDAIPELRGLLDEINVALR